MASSRNLKVETPISYYLLLSISFFLLWAIPFELFPSNNLNEPMTLRATASSSGATEDGQGRRRRDGALHPRGEGRVRRRRRRSEVEAGLETARAHSSVFFIATITTAMQGDLTGFDTGNREKLCNNFL